MLKGLFMDIVKIFCLMILKANARHVGDEMKQFV